MQSVGFAEFRILRNSYIFLAPEKQTALDSAGAVCYNKCGRKNAARERNPI